MRRNNIRSRMLLTAMLPVSLVALLLSLIFVVARLGDSAQAHGQRAKSLVQQMAAAGEYGLFSANQGSLQAIVKAVLGESDVLAVAFVGITGTVVAGDYALGQRAAPLMLGKSALAPGDSQRSETLVEPVFATQIGLDDPFELDRRGRSAQRQLLGHVVVEMSREKLIEQERDMLWVSLGVTILGLFFGWGLALGMAAGVIRPVMRVSQMIGRIGTGELGVRGVAPDNDPLHELQNGLNQMAAQLDLGRQELADRIAVATFELVQKKDEAQSANQAKSRFIAAASHDLRQPLHALGMFVTRLSQLPHDAQTTALVAHVQASVLAMQNLLDALLDLSRLEARSIRVQARALPVNDLFDQLRAAMSTTAQDKGLQLRVRPTQAWAYSDPSLLYRVLVNLLSNAVRYTETGCVLVSCRASACGERLRIQIWDSGVGIAAQDQADVFREFYQVGNRERDRAKGLGLGLNIVQRTAELLGHPLALRSELGCGTRFTLEVPRAAPETPAEPNMAVAADNLVGLNILVIEDDVPGREGLLGLLQSWGCDARAVDRLESAWPCVAGIWQPDLIVSDFRLPDGQNGIDTIVALRKRLGDTLPACLISGDTDGSLIITAKAAGLTLLHKPVRPGKLRSLLHHLIKSAEPKVVAGGV